MRKIHVLLVLLFLSGTTSMWSQFYQGSNLTFGKNRVQYRDFEWSYFSGKYTDVYFYQGGEKLALETAKKSDAIISEMIAYFGFQPSERIYIMSYLSQSDMRQSNIGTTLDENNGLMGTSQIIQNKLFVFFEGNQDAYQSQLRRGLAEIAISQVLLGNSWKDAVKALAFSNYPDWFVQGMAYWLGGERQEVLDVFMMQELKRKKIQINFWKDESARIGGAAFWSFIAERYGSNVIPSILQMSRFARGIDLGFELIIGKSMDALVQEFYQYYRVRVQLLELPKEYDKDPRIQKKMGALALKSKKKFKYRDYSLSPDGKYWAFVTHEWGQYRVWVYDVDQDKLRCILKRQPKSDRLNDYTYPHVAWHPGGEMLAIFYEKRGFLKYAQWNVKEKSWTEKQVFAVDKILMPRFSQDGKNIVFIGVNSGRSDVFVMPTIGNTPKPITKTEEDDYSPVFLPNKKVIYLTKEKGENGPLYVLHQVEPTSTAARPERIFESNYPLSFAFDWGKEEMGCVEKREEGQLFYQIRWDSVIASIDTTIHYRKEPKVRQLAELSYVSDIRSWRGQDSTWVVEHGFYGHPALILQSLNSSALLSKISGPSQEVIALPSDTLKWVGKSSGIGEIQIADYLFADERRAFTLDKKTLVLDEKSEAKVKEKKPMEWRRSNYELNFTTDFATTKLDNSFASQFYQSADAGPTSIFPGMSALFKVSLSDLLEDYRLTGAVRLAIDIKNSDFGVAFENNKDRIDKKWSLQRRSQKWGGVNNAYRQETYYVTHEWKYPLDEFQAFKATAVYRWDRSINLSVDPNSLAFPNQNEHHAGILAEYVMDNTRSLGLNLMQGVRGKFWYERYQQLNVWDKKTDMQVLGGDFRYYVPIHRTIIGAFRVAGATSFGTQKIVHYLGGVDNWLVQRVDESTVISDQMNYKFASFCGPMRGFYINARNGNSFATINSELRLPLFSYLAKQPIKSEFIRHFQVIGFYDVGSAWTGATPYSNESTFNTNSVTQNPVTVTVSSNREPIIMGYGFGLRSKVLGYFMRADWAWGIDDNQVLPRVFYLSLNMDF